VGVKFSGLKAAIVSMVVCCAAAQAASSGYTVTFKPARGNSSASITIMGKASKDGSFQSKDGKVVGLYALLNLSKVDTGRSTTTSLATVEFFSSNANTTTSATGVVTSTGSFGPPTGKTLAQIVFTTNGNGFTAIYSVKQDKRDPTKFTAKVNPRDTKGADIELQFTAVSTDPSKDKIKIVLRGAQVEAAAALLPTVTQGKNQIPAFGDRKSGIGVSGITLLLGTPTFAVQFPATVGKGGKITGSITGQ
jgi:hypothetical protein